jgi:hypothetical protein
MLMVMAMMMAMMVTVMVMVMVMKYSRSLQYWRIRLCAMSAKQFPPWVRLLHLRSHCHCYYHDHWECCYH